MYSWLVWGILQTIGGIAAIRAGSGAGAWWLILGAALCLTIFGLSFKYGTKNIKKFDVYCLTAALIAISFYIFLKNPLYSVIMVAAIDTVAFFPTFRKGYEEPHSETMSLYLLSALTNLISILALQNYSMTTVFYIATLFVTNSTICIILFTRRKTISPSA